MATAGNITAVLSLNASGFRTGLDNAKTSVEGFVSQITKSTGQVAGFNTALNGLVTTLNNATLDFNKFTEQAKGIESFNKFANGVKALSTAIKTLGTDSETTATGVARVKEIIASMESVFGTAEVKVTGLANAIRSLKNSGSGLSTTLQNASNGFKQYEIGQTNLTKAMVQYREGLTNVTQAVKQYEMGQTSLTRATEQYALGQTNVKVATVTANESLAMYHQNLKALALGVEQFNAIETGHARVEQEVATATRTSIEAQMQGVASLNANRNSTMQLITGKNQLTNSERQESTATNQSSSAHQRNSNSMSQATARTNQLTSSTNRLKSAMSSLRMMGNLVGSMLAYNFAHKLLVATGETIHAKSEMEGYFKMLNFGQADIDHFNQALDRTVSQFQRVNKYSLGETISSIGVEFNLTTQEMEKAMKVTSMITSEYLRAGRNANEASLAVKDVLQGQFQRLSRETGVKGEQLKEAGWSGDTTDVLGLMEALEKVGKSRNWDVFAEKANSLNDIITILQNRFGEWSADMVNVVQPSIVNAFNAIMSTAQGFATLLSGFWQWLNTDGWGQLAVKIGMIGTALLTVSQMLVMYRAEVGLVEASQLGLKNSIASVVLGLKGQEIAEIGVRNAIMSKILGVNAETIAEHGITVAIAEKIASLQASTIQEQANTLATGENTTAQILSTDTTTGLATAKEMETAQEEVNTAMKELNTIETLKQEGANTGLIASLYMLGTAEIYDAEATGILATAWGVLNGVFALSPIGWLIAGITALAGAVYVLTGGLDEGWSKMETFNNTIEQGADAVKPYKDRVNQLSSELETAKQKYGENSEEVKNLENKLKDAKGSLDSFYESLQKGTKITQQFKDNTAQISANLDAITRENYGSFGHSTEEIDEVTKQMNAMGYGQDKYYTALQKSVAMQGSFYDDQKDAIPVLTGHGRGLLENAENLGQYNKAYQEYIEHSNKANVADNWWDWAWESYYAGEAKNRADTKVVFEGLENTVRDAWNNFVSSISEGGFFKGDTDKIISGFIDGLGDSYNQWADGFSKWANEGIESAKQGLIDAIDGFFSFDWLPDVGGVGEFFANMLGGIGESVQNFINDPLGSLGISLPDNWSIWSLLGLNTVSASDGSSDHPSILEDLKQGFGVDIQAFIDGMSTDPLGTLGITGAITDITTFLSQLIPISFESVTGFVQNNLITPFGQAVYNGIMSIPLVGDILSLFGLVNGDNSGASQKGTDIGNAFKNKVEEIIRNIPILGDVLQMLGVIPQANGDAHSKGHGVGENIKQGEQQGHTGTAQNVGAEMSDVITAITNAIGGAFSAAQQVGNAIWDGINSILKRASPGFIHDQILAEFGTDIPNAITSSGDVAYTVAQGYGQSVVDGISSVNFNSFGALATDYESDAQTMITTTQLLGLDTTMAFNDMALAVNTTTNTMGTNVIGTYNSMSTQQSSMLQNMKTQNMTAYNDMYQKSNQSLIQMRDSTSNLTAQMTNAWRHMKDQIVATANQLKSESTSHFNQLSNTIGEFYRKIQNPANWGAGSPDIKEGTRRPMVGRRIGKAIHHGAGGGNPIRPRGSSTMSIAQLKKAICPNGDCGSLFDGYSFTDKVDVESFLMSVIGEHGFGWNDWSGTHYNYIKTKSDDWDMKSPTINLVGGIPTNANYKVGDFENGSPKISFESFQSMAESIFSAIPYRFYYDSSWKGSWLGALQAGACNCWDGANALIAFANTCGFSGSIAHGSWNGIPHVWAVIEGRKMDTTGWQNRGTWTPSASAGSPMVRRPIHDGNMNQDTTPVQIEVNINGNVYGVDDLDSHISESIDKGLEKHFNKAYTIGV